MKRISTIAILGLMTYACGGAVDLGGNGSSVNGGNPTTPPPPTDPGDVPGTELVYSFPDEILGYGGIAVDDSYLYMTIMRRNGEGMVVERCSKDTCADRKVIAGPYSWAIERLQVAGGRLAFMKNGFFSTRTSAISICSTPECNDVHDVVADLTDVTGLSMDETNVYWGSDNDKATYRCALPSCGAPELVAADSTGGDLAMNADSVYWASGNAWRVGKQSVAAPEAFELGSESRPIAGQDVRPTTFVSQLAVDDTWIYAAPGLLACSPGRCAPVISRWPAHGFGVREEIHVFDTPIERITLLDGELVIKHTGFNGNTEPSLIESCHVRDCAGTRRILGQQTDTSGDMNAALAAADDRNLYWLTSRPIGGQPPGQSDVLWYTDIRRAARLR